MAGHRNPYKPPWFDSPGEKHCRWCGLYIREKNRRHWHPGCILDYLIIFDSRMAKRYIFERDMGRCQACGTLLSRYCDLQGQKIGGTWLTRHVPDTWLGRLDQTIQLDHVVPLADYPHDPQDPYRAWSTDNLQVLCIPCHKAKTSREAGARANNGGK